MKTQLLTILIFLCFNLAAPLSTLYAGQDNYRIESITNENGLSENFEGGGIIQDSLGFIWIGSRGLQKYDGFSFKQYFHDPKDIKSIRSNSTIDLFSDNDQNLWISTSGGLDRYMYQTDNFRHYYFTNEKQDTIPYDVYALEQDSDGDIYMGINFAPESLYRKHELIPPEYYTHRGIYQFNPLNQKFTALEFVNKVLKRAFTQHILNDNNKDGIFETTVVFPANLFNEEFKYRYTIVRKDKTVEVELFPNSVGSFGQRILKLDHNLIELPIVNFNENMVKSKAKYSSEEDANKEIRVQFRLNLNSMKHHLQQGDVVEIHSDLIPLGWDNLAYIKDIVFDRNNLLWVALPQHGIFLFDLKNRSYKHYFSSPTKPNTLSHNWVRDIFVDSDGDIWISTKSGVNIYNRVKDDFIRYLNDPFSQSSLLHNDILKIAEHPKGNFWVVYTSATGISRLNKHSDELIHYTENLNQTLRSITIDRSGMVWLGSLNSGINKINSNPFKFNSHINFKNGKNLLKNRRILSIYEDSKENTWFGGDLGGLYKYNRNTGQHTFYRSVTDNPDSLSKGWIRDIYEDKHGFIWIYTIGVLNRFDPLKKKFKRYRNTRSDSRDSIGNYIPHIITTNASEAQAVYATDVDNDGDMDVLSASRYDAKIAWYENDGNSNFNSHTISTAAVWANAVYGEDVDSDGDMDVLSASRADDKIAWYENDGSENFTTHIITTNALDAFSVYAEDLDSDGDIDVLSASEYDHKIAWYENDGNENFSSHTIKIMADEAASVHAKDVDSDGDIDVLSASWPVNTIEWYENDGNENFTPHTITTNGDEPCSVYAVDVDGDGNMDVVSAGNQEIAWYANDGNEKFTPHTITTNVNGGHSVYAVDIDCDGDIDVLSASEHDDKIAWYENDGNEIFTTHILTTNAVGAMSVYAKDVDGDGDIDVLSASERDDRIVWYENILEGSELSGLCAVDGILWIISRNGHLDRFDPVDETFKSFNLSQKIFSDIAHDKHGVLWILSQKSLIKFDPKIEKFEAIIDNYNGTKVIIDTTGIIWFNGLNGLTAYDPEKRTKKIISEEDGLLTNLITGIEIDNSGNIWLSSKLGLTKYNPQKETLKNYNKEDDFSTIDLNFGTLHKNTKGEIYFGTNDGFVFFHPDSIKGFKYNVPVVITELKINNQLVNTSKDPQFGRSIFTAKEIILEYFQKDISLNFAALDYKHPERNQYTYILENYEEQWQQPIINRTAVYPNLDPGDYIFKVKGSNSDGVWNEQPATLKITILPPWWQTWWAYSFYALIFFAIVYGLRRYEMSRVHLKNKIRLEETKLKEREQVDQMKSTFFANISHEFRTPLTLILGPLSTLAASESDENKKHSLNIMQRNADRLLRLINQLLDFSRLESGKMNLHTSKSDIVSFVKGLLMSFQSLAEQKKITARFISDKEKINLYFDHEKAEKIFVNLLSNAFKFTPEGGKINVTVGSSSIIPDPFVIPAEAGIYKKNWIPHSRRTGRDDKNTPPLSPFNKGETTPSPLSREDSGGCIQITISNTGPGIPHDRLSKIFDRFYQADDSLTRNQEGTGIGLALTKELIELHKGNIQVESEPGTETTFTVLLPLGKDHLREDEIVKEKPEPDSRAVHASDSSIGDPASPIKNVSFQSTHRDQIIHDLTSIENSQQKASPSSRHVGMKSSRISLASINMSPMVLVVEDNPDMSAYIHETLQNDYQVKKASDGQEGVDAAKKFMPDLIISDLMMPRKDGYQLCNELKLDEKTSHIPIILLTAKAEKQDKLTGLQLGADDYLIKPFDSRELQIRIKNLIEQRRKLREKFIKKITVQPGDISATSMDETFLKKAFNLVEENLDNSQFDTVAFARGIGMSRSHLNAKLRALTGFATREFIRNMRLKHAAQLLKANHGNISEIAYEVGFNNLSHFSKIFKDTFGTLPSDYSSNVKS